MGEAQEWQGTLCSSLIGCKLTGPQDAMIHRHLLWRLYHLTTEITESARKVEEANDKLTDLRTAVVSGFKQILCSLTVKKESDNGGLRDSKREQAQAQLGVKKRETGVKKAEKAYEDKVRLKHGSG